MFCKSQEQDATADIISKPGELVEHGPVDDNHCHQPPEVNEPGQPEPLCCAGREGGEVASDVPVAQEAILLNNNDGAAHERQSGDSNSITSGTRVVNNLQDAHRNLY